MGQHDIKDHIVDLYHYTTYVENRVNMVSNIMIPRGHMSMFDMGNNFWSIFLTAIWLNPNGQSYDIHCRLLNI